MPKIQESRPSIRIFVADANFLKTQLMLSALRVGRHRITVAGYALDSIGFRQGLLENQIDVAIINFELKDGPLAGLAVAREVRVSHPTVRIIMVDFSADSMVVEAFRAGAHGVLSREDSFEVLCKCVHAVRSGQVWANSHQLQLMIEALASSAPKMQTFLSREATSLTQREEVLVHLVTQGLTNRDIAKQMNLSQHTIRNYLFRIFNKLGTSNRLELALYVINRSSVQRPPTDETIVPQKTPLKSLSRLKPQSGSIRQ